MAVTDDRRWIFNRLASAYQARPTYPDSVIVRLASLARPSGRVVDLGAGTGSLALPLATKGLKVSAVEPARNMLEVLRANAAIAGLQLNAVHAAAESTTLPAHSFDLAIVADAAHWLDPELAGAEIARLLDVGGGCAVVDVRLADTPFMSALRHRMHQANPKAAAPSPTRASQLLAIAVPRAPKREVSHHTAADLLDEERLRATVRSLSYVGPAVGPDALEAVLRDAWELAKQLGGAVWSREITVTFAGR